MHKLPPAPPLPLRLCVLGAGAAGLDLAARLDPQRFPRGRAATLPEALEEFQAAPPDVVLLELAPGAGLDLLTRLRAEWPEVPILVLAASGEVGTVVRAIKAGAADFLAPPVTVAELERALGTLTERRELQSEVRRLRQQLRTAAEPEGGIFFAHSPAMRKVKALIDQVADTDATVLIEGESGVGKGLVAQALHAHSARRDQPLVRVNCAALPTELLESELFGYERGAFTGAHRRKPGKFEFAHGGTLVLDEVGEIPLGLQAKLLHVLQDGAFARLGGAQDVRVDVRVIAATNRDLERAAAEGGFRQDLYYRLNVVKIPVPPLRERPEEIPVLAEYFLRRYAAQYRRPVQPLTPATLALMLEYPWPGNVRELENLVRRMVLLRQEGFAAGELTRGAPRALPGPRPRPAEAAAPGPSLRELARTAAQETERALIEEALVKTRWNRREAAKLLRISYRALRYKIQAYGLGNRTSNGNRRGVCA
ncbi:MAG TPA: sigma-54 dependent transcriptional regulator [Candidatus Methylomirabilis sp.]